jgi:hypothetical protein
MEEIALLEVPEVTQLPELSGEDENPVAFADMILTALLRYDRALLYAEHFWRDPANSAVSWRIQPRDATIVSRDIEIGISPTRGAFRSVLARFGHHYLGGQYYNGYATRLLRQGNITRRCQIYMSNEGFAGFWIKIFVSRVGSSKDGTER